MSSNHAMKTGYVSYAEGTPYYPAGKFEITVHHVSDFVSSSILTAGIWEKTLTQRILIHFGRVGHNNMKSRHFIDIGGNIGFFTSLVASLGHDVISVEPFGLNTPLILNTCCRLNPNFIERVHLYKYALSTLGGEKLCIWSTNNEINNGNARVVPAFNGAKDFGDDKNKVCTETVYTRTLDQIISADRLDERPWGMKMDIEGYEANTLKGGTRLILTLAPCVLWFEYQLKVTLESGANQFDMFEILDHAGYKIYQFDQHSLQTSPVTAPGWGGCQNCDYEARLQIDECFSSRLYQ